MTARAITDQLEVELNGRAADLTGLLGLDLADIISTRIHHRAPILAAQLAQDADDRLAAETVIDIMGALWPHLPPEQCGRADWWQTPLGQACARSLGRDNSDAVSQSVAAAMLGVTRGTVAQLVHRQTLDRHPDGGVTRASVLARLVRLG